MTARQQDRPASIWRSIFELIVILFIAVVIAVLLQSFVIKPVMVISGSMSPTIKVGDRLFTDRVTFYFRKPRRGDIVVWRYPPDNPKSLNTNDILYWPFEQLGETLHLTHQTSSPPFVKRVIATEGETFELKRGLLYINGKRVNEPYIVRDYGNYGPYKVPKGMLFCMGDNRPNSRDSRFFGPAPVRAVIGRAFLKWWPPSSFGKPRG
jgi:signal peptidase I